MSESEPGDASRFTILCARCGRPLTARHAWVGREVQCPHCDSILRVPPAPEHGRPVRAAGPALNPSLQFNFGCPRCDTLLEAHTGVCGHQGHCPTCGARLIIPEVNPRTGQPRAAKLLDTDDHDPTPIHAYAADGVRAPRIHRRADGSYQIECPRCEAHCDIDIDSCPSCGAPFTIDAAPNVRTIRTSARGTAALLLGIFSLPLCFLLVPAVVAVALALTSLRLGSGRRSPRGAVAGLVLGLISLGAGVTWWVL